MKKECLNSRKVTLPSEFTLIVEKILGIMPAYKACAFNT